MKENLIKILTIIINIIVISSMLTNICNATLSESFGGNISDPKAKDVSVSIISAVLEVIRIVGVVIAVGILMVIACKYMIASAGDRADIKKYAITYVIGAIILFGASGIAGIIKTAVEGSFK